MPRFFGSSKALTTDQEKWDVANATILAYIYISSDTRHYSMNSLPLYQTLYLPLNIHCRLVPTSPLPSIIEMKYFILLLAACGSLAARREYPSASDISRHAQEICGKAENIDDEQCKRGFDYCVKEYMARERKKKGRTTISDEQFWYTMGRCGIRKILEFHDDIKVLPILLTKTIPR